LTVYFYDDLQNMELVTEYHLSMVDDGPICDVPTFDVKRKSLLLSVITNYQYVFLPSSNVGAVIDNHKFYPDQVGEPKQPFQQLSPSLFSPVKEVQRNMAVADLEFAENENMSLINEGFSASFDSGGYICQSLTIRYVGPLVDYYIVHNGTWAPSVTEIRNSEISLFRDNRSLEFINDCLGQQTDEQEEDTEQTEKIHHLYLGLMEDDTFFIYLGNTSLAEVNKEGYRWILGQGGPPYKFVIINFKEDLP
jgi:hypothetical protein